MGDTEATVAMATVDTVARGRPTPRLLLLPSPRLMLRPTEVMVDTSEDMGAMVAIEARGRPRLTVDMVDTVAMVATDMVATVVRGLLRLRPRPTVDMVDTAAMVATDMVATVARERLRLTVDMVETAAMEA